MAYTYISSGFNLIEIATGKILWYAVPGDTLQDAVENAGDFAIRNRYDVGQTKVVPFTREVEYPPYMQVLLAAQAEAKARGVWQDGDDNLLALETNCFLNMAHDAGRPSDAARSTARSYLSDPARFRQDFHESRKHRANY